MVVNVIESRSACNVFVDEECCGRKRTRCRLLFICAMGVRHNLVIGIIFAENI